MLTEERFARILDLVNGKGSVTVQELMQELDASESTVRRDLNSMARKDLLTKVHGGAIAKNTTFRTIDEVVTNRQSQNIEEKDLIAQAAAKLIERDEFVYLDAGTTTERMIEYLDAHNITFVTNAISHAKRLAERGYRAYILGGEYKSATEAIVGEEAVETLEKYNFTKGFFGTNGVSVAKGYTTPEVKEAMVKKKAMENCKEKFVLADPSKFSEISSVKFADFEDAKVITTKATEQYKKYKNVLEA